MVEELGPRVFILRGKTPVEEKDLHSWAAWLGVADRTVAHSVLETERGPVTVWTYFLGIDHGFIRLRRGGIGTRGPEPVLFETLILDGPDREGRRGTVRARNGTWRGAEASHAEAVRFVEGNKGWARNAAPVNASFIPRN